MKNIFLFPALFIICVIAATMMIFSSVGILYFLEEYRERKATVAWALENPRPEDPPEAGRAWYHKWLLEDIAKWDAIHVNPEAAKQEVKFLLVKTVALGIAGLAALLAACFSFYKACRHSIPAAIRTATQTGTTPPKRIGLLLIPVACILFVWGFISWRGWGNPFDTAYSHGVISLSGLILFLIAVILSSGIPERLAKRIRYGR